MRSRSQLHLSRTGMCMYCIVRQNLCQHQAETTLNRHSKHEFRKRRPKCDSAATCASPAADLVAGRATVCFLQALDDLTQRADGARSSLRKPFMFQVPRKNLLTKCMRQNPTRQLLNRLQHCCLFALPHDISRCCVHHNSLLSDRGHADSETCNTSWHCKGN